MTRATVVGAGGFLGSALTRALVAEGVAVRAVVRPVSNLRRLDGLEVGMTQGDICDPASLQGVFEGSDWVVQAAGRLGEAGVPEAAYKQLHVEGMRNVLEELAQMATRPKTLYISSPGVLGPIAGEAADENAPLAPSNAYERSKAEAELLARQFAEAGLPIVIARPEFVYGPGDEHVLGLFRAVQKGLFFYVDGGRSVCHPTFIDDAVDGMLRCLKHGRSGEVYHITGERPVTFRELATLIAKALGVRPPWLSLPRGVAWSAAWVAEILGRVAGVRPPLSRTAVAFFSEDRRFSWEKARRELGYEPGMDLETGLGRTVAWYREAGLLQ